MTMARGKPGVGGRGGRPGWQSDPPLLTGGAAGEFVINANAAPLQTPDQKLPLNKMPRQWRRQTL